MVDSMVASMSMRHKANNAHVRNGVGPTDAILSWLSKTCGTNGDLIAYDHHVHVT